MTVFSSRVLIWFTLTKDEAHFFEIKYDHQCKNLKYEAGNERLIHEAHWWNEGNILFLNLQISADSLGHLNKARCFSRCKSLQTFRPTVFIPTLLCNVPDVCLDSLVWFQWRRNHSVFSLTAVSGNIWRNEIKSSN